MNTKLTHHLHELVRDRAAQAMTFAVLIGALAGVLAFVLKDDTGRQSVAVPPGFFVSAEGESVPRLAPIRVRFEKEPSEKDAAKLLAIEPAPEGSYGWMDTRTLFFQPKFPGLLRGQEYTLAIPPRPEAGLEKEFRRTFRTEGLLTVEAVIPAPNDVEVPAEGQVLVQFSRSVAPLTLLSEMKSAPVVLFDPPIEGTGEWLNTSLYRFVPKTLAPNTLYRARIPAGLTSAADGVLKEEYRWQFTSYGPAITAITPDANTIYASPTQAVTVAFNQPMDRASVEAGFALKARDGSAVAGAFAWADGDSRFTFQPRGELARKESYTASLAKGLRGANGGETKTERSAGFTTVGIPAVSTTRPANGETRAERYGLTVTFTNPMDEESLDERISITGIAPDAIQVNSYGQETELYINAALKPSTAYTVTIAPGAKDRYGQVMGGYSWSFRTGELPASVNLAVPGEVNTYSASVEPILYYHTTNTNSVSFRLWRLSEEESLTIRRMNRIPPDPPFVEWTPSSQPIRQWTEAQAGPRDVVNLNSTSLSGGGTLPKGDYFVRVSGGTFYRSRMAFSVVDTAIVLKESQDELLAWVLDLDTGAPLAGVNVRASGSGLVGFDATRPTDESGVASFPRENPLGPEGFNDRKGAGTIAVVAEGRHGVASLAWQGSLNLYQLDIPQEYFSFRRYVGHVYTDRPIYRPGERVSFKGVLRLDDDAAYQVPSSNPPVSLTLLDAKHNSVLSQDLVLNEFGTFEAWYELPADADTGNHSIQLTWKQGSDWQFPVGGTSFLVAEFRRPEFQVEVSTAQKSAANGDTIAATVDASFFFGGPVAGAKVEWSVISSQFVLRPKGFESYAFGDFDYYRWDIVRDSVPIDPVRAKGSAVTGPDGKVTLSIPAALKGDEGAQEFTISATVLDQNGQAVAGSTKLPVHPAGFYAGIHLPEYVARAGERATVEVATVDSDGAIAPNRAVVLKVYEREWVTTKEQTPEGARRYRSTPVDKLIDTVSLTTNAKGQGSTTITPRRSGTLRLVAEVTDGRGRTGRSATYLWVMSDEFASWYVGNDDAIRLVADKDRYEVGDTARILVPAPFTGAIGLVTVERGKMHSRSVQRFPTNSTSLEIPIVERSVPDVFVSTVLYRPPTSEDPIPRYKVGYVQLPVETKTRELTVAIQPDRRQAKPGDKVRYDIRVTDSAGRPVKAELSVSVVDKAVLSLAEERSPTGLAAFWYERGLGVVTASSIAVSINRANDAIAEPRGQGKGGGGLDDPRLRQEFKNSAFWKAQLATGADGLATVEVPMPDNLTTWTLQARAVSGDTMVGEGTNELLSTQPLLLRPALPRFLRVGDSLTLRLLVRNATETATDVDISLESEGLDLSGSTSRKAKVEPGASVMLDWPAAVAAEGTAKLTFKAKSSTGLADAVLQELPLTLDVTPETTATGGVVRTNEMFEAVYLPDYAIQKGGKLEVAVQPTLVGVLSGELHWFDPPYPTWRMTTPGLAARAIATIAVQEAELSAGTDADRSGRIKSDLGALISRQRGDGGWPWCDDCSLPSDPYVTAWALLALGEGQAAGVQLSSDAIDRAHGFLFAYVNRAADVKYPVDPNERAFFLYAAARGGKAESLRPTLMALAEQYRGQLNNTGRAYLLLGLAETGETRSNAVVGQLFNDLTGAVIPSANGNHWEDKAGIRYRQAGSQVTAVVLNALVKLNKDHPLIEETVRWLMIARGAEGWQWDLNRAQAIESLSRFGVSTGELAGNYDYRVTLGEKDLLQGRFKPGDGTKVEKKSVALTEIPKGVATILALVRDFTGPGRLYYTVNLRYLTPARDVEALNRGIAVSHEYSLLDAPGTRVSSAKVGDVVRVKVTVMAPAERKYVVVNDLLPAGLEPIDPNLKTVDPALIAKLEAERAAANRPDDIGYWAPWFRWYWSPFDQSLVRDDRLTLRSTNLPKGVHEFTYYARATTPGDFFVAPAYAEESMFPEVFGRSDSGRFTVEP